MQIFLETGKIFKMVVFCVHICEIRLKYPLNVTYPGIKDSKLKQTHFQANFENNVNFPRNTGKISEIPSARMVVFSEHVGGIKLKFPLIAT